MFKRWRKLEKDFKNKNDTFDISKIPDIYDNIKYDILHNPNLMSEVRMKLFEKAYLFSQLVIPFEYGVSTDEKLAIGFRIIHHLLRKINHDLLWWMSPGVDITGPSNNEFGDENQNWEEKGLD